MGAVTTTQTTSAFAEEASFTDVYSGNQLFAYQVSLRDLAGRIIDRQETILGVTTPYHYQYDAAGRLTDVAVGSVQTIHYQSDSNGDRQSRTATASPVESGTYDAQDRLTSYGGATYAYNRAGQLQSVTSSSGSTTYGYDVFNALRSVQLPSGHRVSPLSTLMGAWMTTMPVKVAQPRSVTGAHTFVCSIDHGRGAGTRALSTLTKPMLAEKASGVVISHQIAGGTPSSVSPFLSVSEGGTYCFARASTRDSGFVSTLKLFACGKLSYVSTISR